MNISRTAVLAAAFAASSFAAGQTLPPPAFNGQSYWFGPGPSTFSLDSFVQDSGGFAEMYVDGTSTWVGSGGGPAFVGTQPVASGMEASFNVNTVVTLSPYIYVDGYFGVTASLHGYSGSALHSGESRFYVIHNVPIRLQGSGFTDLGFGAVIGSPTLQADYDVAYANYANPLSFNGNALLQGGTSDTLDVLVDNDDDAGILQVTIDRLVTFPTGASAGTYYGTGQISVSSV